MNIKSNYKNIIETDEFKSLYKEILDNPNKHFFITGKAGTGKTTFLKWFRKKANKNIATISPTGLSALNVNGSTIHKFFKLNLFVKTDKYINNLVYKINNSDKLQNVDKKQNEKFKILKKTLDKLDILIIDEISMVRADTFKTIMNIIYNKNIQLIVFGDICQLPPVLTNVKIKNKPYSEEDLFLDSYRKPWHRTNFESKFFFSIFKEQIGYKKFYTTFIIRTLTKNFRQTNDKKYLEILNKLRHGKKCITDEDLNYLNQRVIEDKNKIKQLYTIVTPKKKKAEMVNNSKLSEIDSHLEIFEATFEERVKKEIKTIKYDDKNFSLESVPIKKKYKYIMEQQDINNMSDDEIKEKITNYFQAPIKLKLKVGAKVMVLINDIEHNNYVNGTIGIVTKIYPDIIKITLQNGNLISIKKHSWEQIDYEYDEETKKIKPVTLAKYTQFPLMLAWAMTIHKSQGQTFSQLFVELGDGIFENGQLYVALSRIQTSKGLYLSRKITKADIKTDDFICKFDKWLMIQKITCKK